MRTDSVAACPLVQTPSIRLPRMSGERRAQRYDETHYFRRLFGQFARIEASEAPTDDADRAALLGPELPQRVVRSFQNPLSQPKVDALSPASWRKPAGLQEAPQKEGACVASGQTGKHKDRMPVAARGSGPGWAQRNGSRNVPKTHALRATAARSPGRGRAAATIVRGRSLNIPPIAIVPWWSAGCSRSRCRREYL